MKHRHRRGDGSVIMEVGIGDWNQKSKESQLLETRRSQEQNPLLSFQRKYGPGDCLILNFWPPELRD